MEKRKFHKRRISRKWDAGGLLFLLCTIFLYTVGLCTSSVQKTGAQENESAAKRQTVQMEYYQYNVCASCHPEDAFFAAVTEKIWPIKQEYPYEISVYNTFKVTDRERLQTRLEELGLTEEEVTLPVLIAGTEYISGADEIENGMEQMLIRCSSQLTHAVQEDPDNRFDVSESDPQQQTQADEGTGVLEDQEADWKKILTDAVSGDERLDAVLLYFSTASCSDCSTVKQFLAEFTQKYEVKIHEFSIAEGDAIVLLRKLFSVYAVEEKDQQVPILFLKDGYLSGAKAITKQLEEKQQNEELTGFDVQKLILAAEEEKEEPETKEKETASAGTYISLAVTGLINGINPCGASMLLMFLAAIAVSGRSLWKAGCAYLAGKFAAYCAMGLGLYRLFLSIDQKILLGLSRGMTWIFAAVFLVLAVLYLIDFIYVQKKQYGKIRMQLPAVLRKWNHERIEQASRTDGRWLLFTAALLGILISAGEFFCTGQVYLAAILYMMKTQQQRQIKTILAFLIYVAAMCVPSLLIVFILEKTKNVIRMSDTTLKWLPVIKLATAIVFFLFAVFMLVQ